MSNEMIDKCDVCNNNEFLIVRKFEEGEHYVEFECPVCGGVHYV